MQDRWARSREYLKRSEGSLAGGVSSPFRRKFPIPLFFRDAYGALIEDVDGNSYIDYALAWGPLILGHKHPALVEALRKAVECPHNYGAQHELEFEVAEKICELVPCAERVLFTSSGSEAVQIAMRLARAFTDRRLIIKFEGHYHGWMDSALVSYHPGVNEDMGPTQSPKAVLGSRGQVRNTTENIVVLPWNNFDAVSNAFGEFGSEIAAVITEPILCNSGCLLPVEGFLPHLREVTAEHRSLLIFDEIITGFRVRPGGGQELFGVTPDLATFGKAVGGGAPLSVIAGRREILELTITGGVVFGGTFNGNPLSLSAAKVTLAEISRDHGRPLADAARKGEHLMQTIRDAGTKAEVPVEVTGYGTAFSVHFTKRAELQTYRDTLEDRREMLHSWLLECLKRGIYLLPDGRIYLSTVHTRDEIERTTEVFEDVLKRLHP